MTAVQEVPEIAPADVRPPARGRLLIVFTLVAIVLATSLTAARVWFVNRIDPLEPPGTRWAHGQVSVRTGAVQGLTAAFLSADKDGMLRGFSLDGLPAGVELVATRVYFLEEAGGPAAPLPFRCLPTGLNHFASSGGRGVSGRFEDVEGAHFRAGDTLQLIAYLRFTKAGPYEIPARVGAKYAVGPLTRTLTVEDTTMSGVVRDDAYPAGIIDGPECVLGNREDGA